MLYLTDMPRTNRTRERLLRGLELFEHRIGGEVTLAALASCAALSEFYSHRLFRAHFGLPVMDYVRRRRLARSADALLDSRAPVLHIAMDAGFESQAAFTRAFRKVYHTTPAAWRGRGRDVPWLSAAAIDQAVLALLPRLGDGQPQLECIDAFAVDGLSDQMDGAGRTAIPDLWKQLAHSAGQERFARSDHIGISDGDAAVLEGILTYTAAISAAHDDPPIAGLERRIIPGGAYLVFHFDGPFARISQAYDHIFGIWMPGSRHPLRAGPSFTRMACEQSGWDHGTMDIWIPVAG